MRFLRPVAAVALVVLLASCDAEVLSTITPDADGQIDSIEVSLTLSGTASEVAVNDPSTAERINELMVRRLGGTVSKTSTVDDVTWTVTASVARVTANASVTGVSGVRASKVDGDVRVEVDVVPPTELADAVRQGALATDPDAVEAALGLTRTAVEVRFPGGVKEVGGSVEVFAQSTSVKFTRSLDDLATGEFAAVGSVAVPTSSSGVPVVIKVLGGLAILGGLGLVLRRIK